MANRREKVPDDPESFADAGGMFQVLAATDTTRSNIILVSVGLIVLVGLASILVHRFIMQRKAEGGDSSMTRPVLALLLVGTVLILAAASLTFDDADTRNLLVGGTVSLSSAAVAFYFASSGATEARRDLLAATVPILDVPNLVGKTLQEAQETMSGTSLALIVADPQPQPQPTDTVKTQVPAAGKAPRGTQTVTVTF